MLRRWNRRITILLSAIMAGAGLAAAAPAAYAAADAKLQSPGSEHAAEAYDRNDITSANLLTSDSNLTYRLDDLGIPRPGPLYLLIGTDTGGTHTLRLDYLDESLHPAGSAILELNGPKAAYSAILPREAAYLKVNGISGAQLYLFELSGRSLLFLDGTHYEEALDRRDSTSANILSANGFATYRAADIGARPGQQVNYLLGTATGEAYTVRVDYLDRAFTPVSSSWLTISGAKSLSRQALPPGSDYIRIHGIPGSPLFLYELAPDAVQAGDMGIPAPESSVTHLMEAYDRNDTTSANILQESGYLVYSLADIGIREPGPLHFLIGTDTGGSYSLRVDYLDSGYRIIGSSRLELSGPKRAYSTTAPQGTAHLKVNGISGGQVYLFEVSGRSLLMLDGSRYNEAMDQRDSTSANILSAHGFATYRLSDIGARGGQMVRFLLGTLSGEETLVRLEYLDGEFRPIAAGSLPLSGVKDAYTVRVPEGAVYVRLYGIDSGNPLSLYELTPWNEE
ncbi:hypothetical protein [Gorillibacterium sp. sgz5001074]|uniref:hypothetical protein n=1 Tax=Gorillibacterium sp. sgz5001074 TaxID=3446695 RepID=UPI003F66E14E